LIRGTDHSDAYINSMYLIKTAIEKGNLPVLYIKGSDMCDKTIRQLEYFTKGVIFVSNIEMFNNHKNNHRWEPLLADRNKKLLLIVTNGNVVVRGR